MNLLSGAKNATNMYIGCMNKWMKYSSGIKNKYNLKYGDESLLIKEPE